MSICEEILISDYIEEPYKSHYVFASLDTSEPNAWNYSCTCYFSNREINLLPTYYTYNNYNWIKEYKCRKFKNDVCMHIKKCFIAKTIVNQYQLGIEAPNWAKNIIGKDYYKKSIQIIQDLSPVPFGEINQGYMRHGIGKVKITDYNYYNVKLISPRKWICNCSDFLHFKFCLHISKRKLLEKHLQNRRELCISLAIKFIQNKS